MILCFVRGCKQVQPGMQLEQNFKTMNLTWSLFIPQLFFPFRFFILPPSPSQRTNRANRAKLGERRQWFPLNRLCIQKLIKDKLARKPDDNKHRVVKKNSRCTIEPEQSCFCVKKKKQAKTVKLSILWSDFRTECAHHCTSRVVVGWVDCPTC